MLCTMERTLCPSQFLTLLSFFPLLFSLFPLLLAFLTLVSCSPISFPFGVPIGIFSHALGLCRILHAHIYFVGISLSSIFLRPAGIFPVLCCFVHGVGLVFCGCMFSGTLHRHLHYRHHLTPPWLDSRPSSFSLLLRSTMYSVSPPTFPLIFYRFFFLPLSSPAFAKTARLACIVNSPFLFSIIASSKHQD